MPIDKAGKKITELAPFYRAKLLDDAIPFWLKRTVDREKGGFFTCFNRKGDLTSGDKYVWMQGRNLWMFSALYNCISRDEDFLKTAAAGRSFLLEHAYSGAGRWRYSLDRNGREILGTISIFSDLFVLAGLAEYAMATGSKEDIPFIEETLGSVLKNFNDPDFREIYHGTWIPGILQHGPYMTTLDVLLTIAPLVGSERVASAVHLCTDMIEHCFARDEDRLLFEMIRPDGTLSDFPAEKLINPGHALESMWFCIHAGLKYNDNAVVERAVEIADWIYEFGRDRTFGGIYAFLDASGNKPVQAGWYKATDAKFDDKVWWVHFEALYTCLLCAVVSGDGKWEHRFNELHDYVWQYFHDPEYGECFSILHRDGSVKDSAKGSLWKAAYHYPRALLNIIQLLEQNT